MVQTPMSVPVLVTHGTGCTEDRSSPRRCVPRPRRSTRTRWSTRCAAYFIRRGDASEPVRYEVDRIRNGRSFATRRVVARQAIGAILNLESSYQRVEESAVVQAAVMPDVPGPDALEESSWSGDFGRRFVPEAQTPVALVGAGRMMAWMRVRVPLGDDDLLHRCWLAYLSDDLPCDAVVRAHPNRADIDGGAERFIASLDHSVWFHHPPRVDEWHLYDVTCLAYAGGRGWRSATRSGSTASTWRRSPRRPWCAIRACAGSDLRHDGGDGVEVIEVGEVEDLHVQPLGAGVRPPLERGADLVGRPGHAVAAQLVGLAPDRRGAPRVLGVVGAEADDGGGRPRDRGRVAVDPRTCRGDALRAARRTGAGRRTGRCTRRRTGRPGPGSASGRHPR